MLPLAVVKVDQFETVLLQVRILGNCLEVQMIQLIPIYLL